MGDLSYLNVFCPEEGDALSKMLFENLSVNVFSMIHVKKDRGFSGLKIKQHAVAPRDAKRKGES